MILGLRTGAQLLWGVANREVDFPRLLDLGAESLWLTYQQHEPYRQPLGASSDD